MIQMFIFIAFKSIDNREYKISMGNVVRIIITYLQNSLSILMKIVENDNEVGFED